MISTLFQLFDFHTVMLLLIGAFIGWHVPMPKWANSFYGMMGTLLKNSKFGKVANVFAIVKGMFGKK